MSKILKKKTTPAPAKTEVPKVSVEKPERRAPRPPKAKLVEEAEILSETETPTAPEAPKKKAVGGKKKPKVKASKKPKPVKKEKAAKPVKVISERGHDLIAGLLRLQKQATTMAGKIRKVQEEAFAAMFDYGKYLADHEDEIITEFGTWGSFGKASGIDPSRLSRCLRSYMDFKDAGALTAGDAIERLQKLGQSPSAKLMESSIRGILTGATAKPEDKAKVNSKKSERLQKELEDMSTRAKEIHEELPNTHDLSHEAAVAFEEVAQLLRKSREMDVFTVDYRSADYREAVRSIQYDVVTNEPCKSPVVHHLDLKGGTGGQGTKVPDWMIIPVAHDTHEALHDGSLTLKTSEIARALLRTMALVVMAHYPNQQD